MSEIPLNKFEKEKKVIELHNQGKTVRDIAKEVKMAFRNISKITKNYDKKIRLQAKRENNPSSQIKKISKNSQAFKLFREGKKLSDVVIDLQISAEKAVKLWSQFLKVERMYEAYEFYKDFQYEIPRLLTINNFINNNYININNIVDVLSNAKTILGLQVKYSILKYEIECLQQTKNNLQYSQDNYTLKKVSEIDWNYPKYHI
jgi:hypothetical protein